MEVETRGLWSSLWACMSRGVPPASGLQRLCEETLHLPMRFLHQSLAAGLSSYLHFCIAWQLVSAPCAAYGSFRFSQWVVRTG